MTHSKTIGELAVANGGRPGRLLAVFSTRFLSFLIQLYRWTLSPALTFLFGANSGCRFTPTCSQYAREAVQRHGALAGSLLALKRVCRCNPFGPCGHDPVPERRENVSFNQSLVTSAPTHIEPALIMNRHRIYSQNVLPHPGPLPLGEGEWSADGLKRQTTELVQGFNALPKMGGKGFHG